MGSAEFLCKLHSINYLLNQLNIFIGVSLVHFINELFCDSDS